jgi:4-amino-4-deoxy-L-arabinose transferase-like glycosyltransferase
MTQAAAGTPRWTRVGLWSILALGLMLRLAHVDFGLPAAYHPDEPRGASETRAWLSGDFRLERYQHPPLFKNIAFVGLKVWQRVVQGEVPDTATVTLGMRLVSVLAGTLGVWAVFELAARFASPIAALLAAALYAVLPLTVVSSKYGVPDVLLSLLFAGALVAQIDLARRPTVRGYARMGLLVALAFGAKYNGVVLVLSAVAAHWIARREAAVPLRSAALAFASGALVGLAVSFPLLPFEWSHAVRSVRWEADHLFLGGHRGFLVSGRNEYFLHHLWWSVAPAAGPLVMIAIVGGLAALVRRRTCDALVLFAAALPYYLLSEWVYLVLPCPERYVLPLMGPYMAAAAVFADTVTMSRARGRRHAMIATLALLVVALPAFRTAGLLSAMAPDTRDVMQPLVGDLVPSDATVWVELPTSDHPSLGDRRLAELRPWDPAAPMPHRGDYVLASSLSYRRYLEHPDQQPAGTLFYRRLFRYARLVREVASGRGSYLFNNPTLRLYQMP